MFALINPPFQVNDEHRHLARAFEISNGRFTSGEPTGKHSQVHQVPKGYADLIDYYEPFWYTPEKRIKVRRIAADLVTSPSSNQELVFIKGGAGGYNFVPYVPSIIAIWTGRVLGLPFLWHLYIARLFSVAACSLIAAYAVRSAGRFQWPIALLGLMPMVLTQIGGVSADGITTALSLLLFSLVARSLHQEEMPSLRAQLGALALVVLLALCKPIYLLCGLALPLMGINSGASGLKKGLGLGIAALAAATAGSLAWAYINRDVHSIYTFAPGDQVNWIVNNPMNAFQVVLRSLFYRGDSWFVQMVAMRDVFVSFAGLVGYSVVVIYSGLLYFVSRGALAGSVRERSQRNLATALLLTTFLATASAACLAMYLTYTKTGATLVRGVQGRYFHPVLPALLLALSLRGRNTLGRWLTGPRATALLTTVVILNCACVCSLIGRFYVSKRVDWPF